MTEYELFLAEHYEPVRRALVLVAGDGEAGNDAAQQAFTKAFTSWTTVRRMKNPQGWVYIVGVNKLRTTRRRQLRHLERQHVFVTDHATRAVDTDLTVDVERALRTLTSRERCAVVLRFYADLTVDDIATAMRCRPGTVASTLHRASVKLRKDLSSNVDGKRIA